MTTYVMVTVGYHIPATPPDRLLPYVAAFSFGESIIEKIWSELAAKRRACIRHARQWQHDLMHCPLHKQLLDCPSYRSPSAPSRHNARFMLLRLNRSPAGFYTPIIAQNPPDVPALVRENPTPRFTACLPLSPPQRWQNCQQCQFDSHFIKHVTTLPAATLCQTGPSPSEGISPRKPPLFVGENGPFLTRHTESSRHLRFRARYLLLALVTLAILGPASAAQDAQLTETAYSDRLTQLADECGRRDFSRLAKTIQDWSLPPDVAQRAVFHISPRRPAPSPDAAAAETELFKEFLVLRAARAESLFQQSAGLVQAQSPLAYHLLWAALREDPDHAAARRALGFEKTDHGWFLPFSAEQVKAGRVWHEKFGWIAREDVPRYEKGERRLGTRWINAADDARRHADIRRGWKIETDHYIVTTNHSLEEGARLAAQLERLHQAWRQAFAGYWLKPEVLKQRLDSNPSTLHPPLSTPKHRVTCFRDRAEYVRALKSAQPRIEMSIGVYLEMPRTAYFFAGKEQDAGTIFHEATHQLFKEARPTAKSTADRPNFWIIEAVACYMESLTAREGYDTLGEPTAGRLPAARERLLNDRFYVPLTELIKYDAAQLQRDPRVAKIYSQSAGLATFLMHHENARYRAALMKYLQAVYSGKATPTTLEEATGQRLDELDRQYRAFLESVGNALRGVP
jgi:hypothetical protein